MMDATRENPITHPQSAIAGMVGGSSLRLLGEEIPLAEATGRLLLGPLHLDRPSPPLDVSSMDGFAVRLAELGKPLPVRGIAAAGQPPVSLPPGAAIKIFTGAPVPAGADLIIKREDAIESDGAVVFSQKDPRLGQFIRRAGENAPAGLSIPTASGVVTPTVAAAIAAAGISRVTVRRKLRIAILTTGDELIPPGQPIAPYQIRDSNGPALTAMFQRQPWADVLPATHVRDDADLLTHELASALSRADAVLLTGGVSMGDFDHVPASIVSAGARIVFHKLPTRPGKPLLGALSPTGQPILGLPGNPVSVLTTARWFALRVLGKFAGVDAGVPLRARIVNPDTETLNLHWFRLAHWAAPVDGDGAVVKLLTNRGSGDIISAAASDGFVHIPPNTSSDGAFPFYPWLT